MKQERIELDHGPIELTIPDKLSLADVGDVLYWFEMLGRKISRWASDQAQQETAEPEGGA